MAKAKRPVFVPIVTGFPFVKEVLIEFDWYPGFAKAQAQKCVVSLHRYASQNGISPVLEISSKSMQPFGVSLSAFNLMLSAKDHQQMSVECAFQGSKVFEKGGPYQDLYSVSSREAKTDTRLRNSGDVVAFRFFGESFPTRPMTAFYDWLYITALWQNPKSAEKLLTFKGFSDIAFNPKKSINCQARSAALYVALHRHGAIQCVVEDKEYYISLITGKKPQVVPVAETTRQLELL